MSETTTCSSCGASVPPVAKFCSTCGEVMNAAVGRDATTVDGPRPDSPTPVLPPVASSAPPAADPGPSWAPATDPAAPAPSQPWAPTDAGPSTPEAPPAPAWGQPPAPGGPPAGAPPAWQQPAAPPYGQPPAAQPTWGAPAGQSPAWGQGPAPTAAPEAKKVSPLGGLLALIGGVLTLVGIFTAWVGPKGGGKNFSGWDLTKTDNPLKSPDAYFLLALAIVALVIGVLRFTGAMAPVARLAAVIIGLVIIGIMIRDWLSIVDVVKKLPSDVRFEQKFGYFLAIAGGVVTAASALMPSAKKTP